MKLKKGQVIFKNNLTYKAPHNVKYTTKTGCLFLKEHY